MDTCHEEEYKGYRIEIYQDDSPESPREWDNLGFMACWHRRMWLGDEPEKVQKYTPEEWFEEELGMSVYEEWEENYSGNMGYLAYLREQFEKENVVVPIYAYEHGGITISSGYRAGWDSFDSGQLGFIYVSKKKALDEWKKKKWTQKFEETIVKILEGEIETYDQYLRGEVFGYKIFDADGEELDSCWGCYGEDYCIEEAKSIVDWYVKKNKETKKKLLDISIPIFSGLQLEVRGFYKNTLVRNNQSIFVKS